MAAKRILFVDDEPMVLAGLERGLYAMRNEWQMEFVASGQEALRVLEQQAFDVVVTDVRMPEMSGPQLLEKVKRRFPGCLRLILSGQADKASVLKAVNPAHQFLAKPCNAEELRARLAHALTVRDLLQNVELRGLVSRLESLPSLPTLYTELTNEINKSEPSVARIGALVSEDMGMTAKILQLVNSSFFGLRCQVSSPSNAVQLLGLDILRALVVSEHVFSKFQTTLLEETDIQYLWEHSVEVGSYAKRMAMMEGSPPRLVDDCFTAGLLHDVGKLVLASSVGTKYGEVLKHVRESQCGLVQAENAILGCSHPEIGAYLLGLWGLPNNVIEGVACHHCPAESFPMEFSPVVATHVAAVYHERRSPHWLQDGTVMDEDYLRKTGCQEKELAWRRILEEDAGEGGKQRSGFSGKKEVENQCARGG